MHKKLAHRSMAEKSHDLPSASWRKAGHKIPIQAGSPATINTDGVNPILGEED
jgi:hypothetical protein